MTRPVLADGVRARVLVAVMLAVGALVLFAAYRASERSLGGHVLSPFESGGADRQIDAAVDTLLNRYGIERAWVRSWRVQTPGKKTIRIERRVQVPPEFVSLAFNHELNQLVSQVVARAVASEKSEASTVTMHIIRSGMIVESIAFVTRADLKHPEEMKTGRVVHQ